MNLWVIHQTTAGTKKWKLEPRKNPWVLGTSRESALRINATAAAESKLFGSFDYQNNQWSFTRLTPPDPDNNIQRSICINEATEISFADISLRVVPLKDKAGLLGTNIIGEKPDKSKLNKLFKELTTFKMAAFFDNETTPFLGSAMAACLLLLIYIALAPKPILESIATNQKPLRTIEIKTNFLLKSPAITQAMKNSVAPKQQHAPSASASAKNSKQIIGAIFSKIQSRSLQKVLKNVSLTASSKNIVAGAVIKNINQFSKNIPDGKQLAALGNSQNKGLGTIGVNTISNGSGAIAGLGKMDHGDVGNAQIGLVAEESQVQGGLDREVISKYIQSMLGPILYCYERQLSANPSLFGKVAVKFSIKADGFVDHSEISETTLRSQSVEGCLLSQVNQWQFPKPKGGMKVVVTYPFMFKSIN